MLAFIEFSTALISYENRMIGEYFMPTKQISIPSADGIHKLHVVVWEPQTTIRAILQISHGMVEFIERYSDFANYMNEHGILVVGNDHLGHGQTAGSDEDFGYFCKENMSATVVEDLHNVTKYIKNEYPGIPYFLLGHSMGSFMARRYIMTYGDELAGSIISGTGYTKPAVLSMGFATCSIVGKLKGERHRSKLMKNIAFGSYNKRIQNPKSGNDWLTRDESIVEWYNNNKYCTFMFTVNGYRTLFDTIKFVQKEENYRKIPSKLPILFVAGLEDPVGDYGEAVKKVYQSYRALNMYDVNIKLYPSDRHEIFNELDRQTVYSDVLSWIEVHLVK